MRRFFISIILYSIACTSLLAWVITPIPLREGHGGRSSHLGEGEGREASSFEGEGRGTLSIIELNCENLFDCQHDSLKDDMAFTPEGSYRWTPGRYWKKLNHIAQTILSCGYPDEFSHSSTSLPPTASDSIHSLPYREEYGGKSSIPDFVALCEVENDTVLRDLTQRSLLRNARYEYIVTNSPDQRGVDVAFMYSPFSFGLIDHYSIRVNPREGMRPTRDILYVKGQTVYGDTLHIFVVHAPSRSGGEYETRPNRELVTTRLTQSTDSIFALEPEANIIVAGDFNDYTENSSLKIIENHNLTDVSANATGYNGAEGTYKYQGEWGSLDHIFVSKTLQSNVTSCRIADAPFLLTKDETYGGVQPLRNFNGVKWQNGFSDHLPLCLRWRVGGE